jgi:short subunit dehydrogenase-like uncharacterized protein
MQRPVDVLVVGATGFTGKLVVEYLLSQYPDLSWAMGGRSAAKLGEVATELGVPASVEQVVIDTTDPTSVKAALTHCRLVLSTVGPYQLYGEPLLAACAQMGVHYVDLCGEPAWMRQMIDRHETAAKASGACIVFSCGFDSIPFDLGVWHLQQAFVKRFGQPSARIKGRVLKMKGRFSGGTAASLKATMAAAANPEVLALLRNPFSLTPGFTGPSQPSGSKVMFDEALDSWAAPFVMAAINTRNIHRSNCLMGHAYGEQFVYDEMLLTGPGERGEAMAHAVAQDKSLGAEGGPKPGEGPSREEREAGHYEVLFVAEGPGGQTLRCTVSGQGDPGYASTSKMIVESALAVLGVDGDKPGGIFTPAALVNARLLSRLQARAGLSFSDPQ